MAVTECASVTGTGTHSWGCQHDDAMSLIILLVQLHRTRISDLLVPTIFCYVWYMLQIYTTIFCYVWYMLQTFFFRCQDRVMGFVGGGGNIAIATALPPSFRVYCVVNI